MKKSQQPPTYTTLMKATIAEAIGFDGSDDEKELLERQVNGLNDKMIAIVNESIASGEDIESREAEIKEIADTIEDLKRRIQIITENSMKNAEYADRIAEIERIITERASHQNEYVKTGNGKRIDFALRNPQGIKKIDSYELPTDDELMLQSIDAIICETCYLNEHCSGYCVLSKQKKVLRQSMLDILKSDDEK